MITTSAAYKTAITSINRHMTFNILKQDGTELPLSQVTSLKITKAGASQQKLLPGEFCKAQCKMETTVQVIGNFTVACTVSGANDVIVIGKYWVNSCEYDDGKKRYQVVAYDVPPWFESICNAATQSVSDILSEIENSSGMQITNKNLITLTTIESIEEDTTWMELLALLAGQQGYSVRTHAGNLELYKYTAVDYSIPISRIYETGLNLNKVDTTINYYLVNEQYTVGSGAYGIRYRNMYITSQEQTEAMADYVNLTYTPMHVKFTGDPSLQLGDIITVATVDGQTHTCLVMDMDITIDGGFAMDINCYSDEQVRSVISERPVDRKIRELRYYTQTSLERIMDSIFSEGDGYYFEIDANGDPITGPDQVPAGFQITDSSMTQGWRFILGGLYHSNDGFQSVNNLAISADGQIYGQFLAANSVEISSMAPAAQDTINGTQRFITFEDGQIRIGEKDPTTGEITSDYQSLFTQYGMRVMDSNGNVTLSAEQDTVDAVNLSAHQYFRIVDDENATNSRFQGFYNSIHDKVQHGIFWEK